MSVVEALKGLWYVHAVDAVHWYKYTSCVIPQSGLISQMRDEQNDRRRRVRTEARLYIVYENR